MNLIALMAVMGFASLYPSYDSATRLLTMSRVFCFAREAAGALGTRLSLLPPFSRDDVDAQPGRITAQERERMARTCLPLFPPGLLWHHEKNSRKTATPAGGFQPWMS